MAVLDFLDFLDFIIDPVLDLYLCEGKIGVWIKKCLISSLLAAGNIICLLRLFSAIRTASVLGIAAWAIGTVLFGVLDWHYALWWYRDGRFGADCPLIDKIPLPKGNLMNTPPEDTPFGVRPPEDIWEKMGVR